MRNFENVKKIVLKIGTNTLTKPGTIEIDLDFIRNIAKEIADLRAKDIQVVVVTSGAIGMGAGRLGIREKVTDPKRRQACAAIGQPLLMQAYNNAFLKFNLIVAQVLLTSDVLGKKITYINLRNAIDELLTLKTIPILNENDSVSTEEIGSAFGDNDKLSALVASKIDADLLVMLTDIDAFYDKDPNKFKDATPIRCVEMLTDEIISYAGQSGSKFATGGMRTKIAAVKIAFDADCRIVIAKGREKNVLNRILNGDEIGTIFLPTGIRKRTDHERWILNRKSVGEITIDSKVFDTLRKAVRSITIRQSQIQRPHLLSKDVLKVVGDFEGASVITINNALKAVTRMSSNELNMFKGKRQSEIREIAGKGLIVADAKDIVEIGAPGQ
jgi:glutamate 5-kinase